MLVNFISSRIGIGPTSLLVLVAIQCQNIGQAIVGNTGLSNDLRDNFQCSVLV